MKPITALFIVAGMLIMAGCQQNSSPPISPAPKDKNKKGKELC
jgi:hypothetical protein